MGGGCKNRRRSDPSGFLQHVKDYAPRHPREIAGHSETMDDNVGENVHILSLGEFAGKRCKKTSGSIY